MCGSNRTCGVCDTIFDWIAKILWRNCLGSNSGGFFELFVSGIKDIDLEIQTLYNKNIKKVRFLIRKGDDFMPLVVQDIIYEFTKEIKKIFGTNLSTVIVYGSYARGDYNENSDVDVNDIG